MNISVQEDMLKYVDMDMKTSLGVYNQVKCMLACPYTYMNISVLQEDMLKYVDMDQKTSVGAFKLGLISPVKLALERLHMHNTVLQEDMLKYVDIDIITSVSVI